MWKSIYIRDKINIFLYNTIFQISNTNFFSLISGNANYISEYNSFHFINIYKPSTERIHAAVVHNFQRDKYVLKLKFTVVNRTCHSTNRKRLIITSYCTFQKMFYVSLFISLLYILYKFEPLQPIILNFVFSFPGIINWEQKCLINLIYLTTSSPQP